MALPETRIIPSYILNLSFSPQISVILTSHRGNFFLQQMETVTENYKPASASASQVHIIINIMVSDLEPM